MAGPSDKYLLGNDDLGRDLLSRLIYGTRVSLAVGVFSQVSLVLIGVPLGAIAGMMGGWVDYALTRLIDVLSSIPGLLLYILLMIALGAGLQNIILAMSPSPAGSALRAWYAARCCHSKESDFVRAARSMGAGTSWIVRTHIVRNSLTPVIVAMTLGVPGAMFAEAGLSFLGLGVPPPTPSWGQIVGIYPGLCAHLPAPGAVPVAGAGRHHAGLDHPGRRRARGARPEYSQLAQWIQEKLPGKTGSRTLCRAFCRCLRRFGARAYSNFSRTPAPCPTMSIDAAGRSAMQ